MKPASILITLFGVLPAASFRLLRCDGKPPASWGPPNCNEADKNECKNLCTGGRYKCTDVIPKNGDGYWDRDTNLCDCYCY